MVQLSLRFVFGRAGSGKSTICLEEIRTEIRQNPVGPSLIMLVPEQATHQMEVALTRPADLGGIMRAQVLSFRRLSWRILAETGGGNRIIVGENGKRMLLRRLLLKHRSQLRVLARSATRPGMADNLARLIGEFKSYRLGPKDLLDVEVMDVRVKNKLQDLALLYAEYDRELQNKMLDASDELNVLADKIPTAISLKETMVWVDGFKGFTPQELQVLGQLLVISSEVVVTLPIDPEIIIRNKEGQLGIFSVGEEFFSDSWQTYQAILRLAGELGILRGSDVFLSDTPRFHNNWLRHLERNFYCYPTNSLVGPGDHDMQSGLIFSDSSPISIRSAVNKRTEVEGIARELQSLVRDKELRWNQMALMCRNLNDYHEMIEQVFSQYQIPCFIDHKRTILHHPLIELLVSAVELTMSNWAYEPLFRCLKTDFFPLSPDAVDRLENYCLAHGIRGAAWEKEQDWNYRRQWALGVENPELSLSDAWFQSEINTWRREVRKVLLPFVEGVASSALSYPKTVREVTEALYSLLERLRVPERLQEWGEAAQKAGNLSEARLQQQIWADIMELFDEMVAGLGDESLELADYLLILTSGLENLELGLIPPSLDQVLIGSLDRSRNPEVRVLFLLGANEGVLPKRPETEGLLSSSERDLLENAGIQLAPRGKAQIFEEQFFIYNALTRATDKIYLTYTLTDEEGKGLAVSSVISRLQVLFPDLVQEFWDNKLDDLDTIGNPQSLLDHYAVQLRELNEGVQLSALWQGIEKWLTEDPRYGARVKFLQAGVNHQNQEAPLERGMVKRLYGQRLLASVSRLEQFARCPFAHYARYGLKLRDRTVYKLSNPDMGEYFHALLRDFALQVRENNLDWGNMTKAESWALLSTLAERLAPQLQNEILLSSARYRYLEHRLKRTVNHAVRVLAEHARQGMFTPIRVEVGFGPQGELPGKVVPLSDGDYLILRGQIDRVDAATVDGQVYLRIIDYKSQETSLDLDSIYYGLNLQLLAYLDVALNGAQIILANEPSFEASANTECKPAGFLYFPVLEPFLNEKAPLAEQELDEIRLKAVKVQGYFLANPQVLEAMDKSLTTGKSDLLGLKLNKDGTFRKGTNVFTSEQLSLLRDHLDCWLQKTGEKIVAGDISLSPVRRGKRDGCQYCLYRPVCHFDPSLAENKYRVLEKIESAEIWKQMETERINKTEKTNGDIVHWLGEGDNGDG